MEPFLEKSMGYSTWYFSEIDIFFKMAKTLVGINHKDIKNEIKIGGDFWNIFCEL